MKSKLSLLILATLLFTPITAVHAEIDELGYEYTPKRASEIDFSDGDFYIAPLSSNPGSENAIYAVYENSEVEKYEKPYQLF